MTKEELMAKIAKLRQGAETLDEPERTFKLADVDQLEIQIAGMALDEIADKMRAISLPDTEAMDVDIKAARDATAAHALRVAAFDKAYGLIKTGLGFAV